MLIDSMKNKPWHIFLVLAVFGASVGPSFTSEPCAPEQVLTKVKSVDSDFLDDFLFLLLERKLHTKSQHISSCDSEVSLDNLDVAYLWKRMPSPELLNLYQLCKPPKGHMLISMEAKDEALKIASSLKQPWHDAILSILGSKIVSPDPESEGLVALIIAIDEIDKDNLAAAEMFSKLRVPPKFRSLACYGEALALTRLGKQHDALAKFELSRKAGTLSAVRLLNEGLVAKTVFDYVRASECFLSAARLVPFDDTLRKADLHAEMMICDKNLGRKQPTVLQFSSGL